MRLDRLVTPLKALEAMARGRIFVASDIEATTRNSSATGETGRLFAADRVPALVATLSDMLAHRDRWPPCVPPASLRPRDVRNWKNSVANF